MVSASSLVLMSFLAAAPNVELWEFTAPWCSSCTAANAVVHALADEGIPVRQIPVDNYRELAEQANVKQLPTFLVVSNGQVLGRRVGASSKHELRDLLQNAVDTLAVNTQPALNPRQEAESTAPIIRGQAPGRPFSRIGNALSAFGGRLGGSGNGSPRYEEDPFAALPPMEPNRNPLLDAPMQPPASFIAKAGLPTAPPTRQNTNVGAVNLSAAVVSAPLLATPPVQAIEADPAQRAMNATVRLRIEDPLGVSLGTGTIIDIHDDEALVLTCGHIFRDSKGEGTIYCDLLVAGGPQRVPGTLIRYDLKRDIGIVSLRPGISVQPVPLERAGYLPSRGDAVFAIGCNHGQAATTIQNRILDVNRYQGPANFVVGGRPVDGRSGGGLFSSEGRLIGLCNAADIEEDEGLYAAISLIQAELDALDLGFIYRDSDQRQNNAKSPPTRRFDSPIGAQASFDAPPSGASTTAAPQISAGGAEVICIVRPKSATGGPGDAGKAYVLDKPSKELLGKLSEELGKRGPHQFTGGYQRRDAGTSR